MTDQVVVRDIDGHPITPETVLTAYQHRCFPMAESRGGPIAWFRPTRRAIITWDRYRVPRSLTKVLRHRPFRVTRDRAFAAVIAACANRDSTWISHDIEALYLELHRQGHAHSVEAWDADGQLAGGLYGLVVGGCFSGESMFHLAPDAAKACVVDLVDHLRANAFAVLDCQQQSPHMQRFGAYEVTDRDYAALLARAAQGSWTPASPNS